MIKIPRDVANMILERINPYVWVVEVDEPRQTELFHHEEDAYRRAFEMQYNDENHHIKPNWPPHDIYRKLIREKIDQIKDNENMTFKEKLQAMYDEHKFVVNGIEEIFSFDQYISYISAGTFVKKMIVK